MDVAKGLAALTVVFFHIIVPGQAKVVLGVFSNILMAVFFLASGYFYKTGSRSIGENIYKRFKAVLMPFLRYSLVLGLIGSAYYLLTHQVSVTDVLCLFRNFYAGSIWNKTIMNFFGWDYHALGTYFMYLAPFWFLVQMFIASVIFFLLVDRCIRSGRFLTVCSVLLLAVPAVCEQTGVELPYNLDSSCFFAVFMLAGACLGQREYFEKLNFKDAGSWIVFAVSTAVTVVLAVRFGKGFVPFRAIFGSMGAVSVLIMSAACASFAYSYLFLCRFVESNGIRLPVLTYFGRNSLYLYMMHMFFAWALSQMIGFNLKYSADTELPPGALWISLGLIVSAAALCAGYIRVREYILKKTSGEKLFCRKK